MSLLSFLRADRRLVGLAAGRVDPAIEASAYPSVDPGIAVRSVEEMLAAHADLVARVKLCYGADRSTFEHDLLVPIRNFATYVNLLPATADNFFCEQGGLFRLGLEVAFFALQGTDGHIVSGRSTITTRRLLEPRWRHATFLAGLCSEIHRTLGQIIVTDDRGDEWPAYLGPLTAWLEERRSRRFFVRWLANAQETRALGLFALPHIVSAKTMQHLAVGNAIAVPHLLSCLSGQPLYREQNILVDLVKRATALVIDRDLIACANRYGKPILGAHIERYLIDAMRRLVASHPAWQPNDDKSRVWHAKDGLFIVWPNAAHEIRKLLEDDELPGIPKAPETILEILVGAGVCEPFSPSQTLWTISPPPGKASLEAAKLASPDILLPPHGELLALAQPIAVRASNTAGPRSNTSAPDATAEESTPGKPTSTPTRAPATSDPPSSSDGASCGEADARQSSASDSPPVSPQAPLFFKLASPMRLNPQVRDALSSAIDSLNLHPRESLVVTVATGVFVPLSHFKRARLDIPVVLRALSETGMTLRPPNGPPVVTVEHEVRGQLEAGVVLLPRFVHGLDPADFATDT